MESFIMNEMPKVYFGNQALSKAFKQELCHYGKNIMLTYGGGSIKKNGIYDEVITLLKKADKNIVEFDGIMANPTYAKVQEGAMLARKEQIDLIIAVGGGSVIDCSKVISAQAMTNDDLWTMEFENQVFPQQFIPMAAVVSASGTGAEMNNGAVITHEEKKIKAGMRGALADFSVLDPSYTLTVPMKQVLSGAFDTFSHAMETYFGTPYETNVSDQINEAIMRNIITNVRALLKNPNDLKARSELMWDSAMAENGILKLGKVTDFQAHQIEHQLGAYTNCNHEQGLAVIHPHLYRHIYQNAVAKFSRYAREVWQVSPTLREEQQALSGIEALAQFIQEMNLPTTLTQMGITDQNLLRSVANSCNISKGCAKQLTHEEIYQILLESL